MDLPSPGTKSIDNAIYIEHMVQKIITQQEANGVLFNVELALKHIITLETRQAELYTLIRPTLSKQLETPYTKEKSVVNKPFLKSGGYTSAVTKWMEGELKEECSDEVAGPFTRIEYVEPDLSKRAKLVAQLLRLGWIPTEYTKPSKKFPTGSPKLTVEGEPCPNLMKITGVGGQIAEWYIRRHRQGQIKGLLKLVRDDGRISAQAITIGTPTFRFRHKGVVNIPKAGNNDDGTPLKLFGKEMRELFTVPEGKVMVGWDAAGLELRMLADAINDETFTHEVIDGDIHTKNQMDAGLPTRDDAKTFIYAFIYGAGDGKLGSIVGAGVKRGRTLRSKFLSANPKLAECIEKTKRASERGYLIGSDGRKVTMRRGPDGKIQTHKALNTRLQTGGALVMKWAMVLHDEWCKEYNLDTLKVIDMHDENQHECSAKDAHMVGALGCLSVIEAGRMLNLNIPLAANYKTGKNWSETH